MKIKNIKVTENLKRLVCVPLVGLIMSTSLSGCSNKATKLDTNQLKKTLFLKTIHNSLDKTREHILRNALNKWQRASKDITNSYNRIQFTIPIIFSARLIWMIISFKVFCK